MHGKFTYFDFMMYVLPGAILEACILAAAGLSDIGVPDGATIGSFLETVMFVFGAFVLGHFAYSGHRERPDRRIVITQIGHRDRSEATLVSSRS